MAATFHPPYTDDAGRVIFPDAPLSGDEAIDLMRFRKVPVRKCRLDPALFDSPRRPIVTRTKSHTTIAVPPVVHTVETEPDPVPAVKPTRATYVCVCGRKPFRNLGDATVGAIFHATWTAKAGQYGEGKPHFIPEVSPLV